MVRKLDYVEMGEPKVDAFGGILLHRKEGSSRGILVCWLVQGAVLSCRGFFLFCSFLASAGLQPTQN